MGWIGAHPLEYLLSFNILQPCVQVPDPLDNIGNFILILALDLAGLTDGQVKMELDVSGITGEPAMVVAGMRYPEAETVLARVASSESETAGGRTLLVHDSVVIVENFLWVVRIVQADIRER